MRLQIEREIADLIKKERAPMGGPDKTNAIAICSGECTPDEPKELGANESRRNGSAIQCDERSLDPHAVAIYRASNQFLTRAGFSFDQNRQIGGGNPCTVCKTRAIAGSTVNIPSDSP